MKAIVLPSVIGVGNTDLGMLTAGHLGHGRRPTKPHSISWNGASYLTGAGVERFARPIERMDFVRLADGPDVRALTYTTLGLLLGPGAHTLSVMIGFPVALMADRAQAQATLRGLRAWLVDGHQFVLDNREISLRIQDVKAIPQPLGTYFSWGLNEVGEWGRSTEDLKALTAICDIGFNTLDLYGIQEGQVQAEYTGGDTIGVRRAAEILSDLVRKHQVHFTRHEADGYLQDADPVLHCSAGAVSLQKEVAQALEASASEIIGFLNSYWEQVGRIRHMLFSGGGSVLFRPYLSRSYSTGLLLPEAVVANAIGLARYGRRAFGSAHIVVGLDPGFGGFKAVVC